MSWSKRYYYHQLRSSSVIPTTFAMSTTQHLESEPLVKRQKLDGPLIGTHNGTFHADEALAVYLLRLLPEYANSPLVRTRDPAILATCHIVVDVGGVHDDTQKRYDHHQRGFTATFPGRATKLSSAGLVYMHFGRAILAQLTGLDASSAEITVLHEHVYSTFVEAIDAADNGLDAYDGAALAAAGVARRFSDSGFTLGAAVARFNRAAPRAAADDDAERRQRKEDERFARASVFMGEQFAMEVADKADAWLPARAPVREAYAQRRRWHPSGRVVVLRDGHVPFASHLYDAERDEAAREGAPEDGVRVYYVLFPEDAEENSKWRVRAVTVEGMNFKNRKDLPTAWKGLRDEELDKVSGVDGCVFVHANGFIGGNKTFEGALEMAKKAVEME